MEIRVFIVDDSSDFRTYLKNYLEQLNNVNDKITIIGEAGSYDEAVSKLKQRQNQPPDILFLDYDLDQGPQKTGCVIAKIFSKEASYKRMQLVFLQRDVNNIRFIADMDTKDILLGCSCFSKKNKEEITMPILKLILESVPHYSREYNQVYSSWRRNQSIINIDHLTEMEKIIFKGLVTGIKRSNLPEFIQSERETQRMPSVNAINTHISNLKRRLSVNIDVETDIELFVLALQYGYAPTIDYLANKNIDICVRTV